MNRYMKRRIRHGSRLLAVGVLLLPLALAACSGGEDRTSPPIDAPPADVEDAMIRQSESAYAESGLQSPESVGEEPTMATEQPEAQPDSGEQPEPDAEAGEEPVAGPDTAADSMTVYLLDPGGYVAPMTLRSGSSERSAAETALGWLIESEQLADRLPEGFAPLLPAGTAVRSVTEDAETGTVAIDFASPLPAVTEAKERKLLEAIVWTMTELPGIDKVKLTVDGKPLRTMPLSELPVPEALTRGIGINIEQAEGVQANRSMAVTLYFSSRTVGGEGYFVPVTRLIERQANRAEAALDQLIAGPLDQDELEPVVTAGTTVEQLTAAEDTVNVSLNDADWKPDTPVSAQMMEALVLTLTEATGTPQVKVAMNGSESFVDTEDRSYELPVTRPVSINALKQ